jgi:hypothetical protein
MRLDRLPPLAAPCPHCGGRQPALFHTSCAARAAWSSEERAAFALADARDEALEHDVALPPRDLDLVAAAPRRPPVRAVTEAVLAHRRSAA